MYKYLGIIVIVIVCICSLVYAGTIFEDSFDSDTLWVNAYPGGDPYTGTAENGLYTVDASSIDPAIIKHDLTDAQQVENFTYSVKMEIQSANTSGCGIIFCWQDDFSGYLFLISADNVYYVIKYVKGSASVIVDANWNSFVNSDNNTLKVSKNGNEINIFCNDVFLERFTDSQFSKGNIGLFLNKANKVAFDHALLTDVTESGEPKIFFSDSFEDDNLYGWRKLIGVGDIKAEDGVLKISEVDSTVILYTNGSYKNAPCTTVVTYKEGNKSTLFGLCFMNIKPNQNPKIYQFWINGDRSYAVCTNSGSFTIKTSSFINATTNTLIITPEYNFIINGNVVDDSTTDEGLEFNAVGFHVDPGVSVEFDDFSVGPGQTPIVFKPIITPVSKIQQSYILGGTGIIYDPRGRKVATFVGGYEDKLKNLSSGPYFIIMKGKKNHIVRRAIINTQ